VRSALALLVVADIALAPLAAKALALPEPDELYVCGTSSAVIVDGNLNMSSEWNGSSVVTWYNPLDGNELDTIYLLHNSTHYLIAAELYDPDHKKDDEFRVYVEFGNTTYEYVLEEDSTAVALYNVTSGTPASLTSNATGTMTRSHHCCYWVYVELAVPKGEWGNATDVRMFFEHEHTHKLTVVSRYPEDANSTRKDLWLTVHFVTALGQYGVELRFKDRDLNPIDYVANESYAVIAFDNGTIYTTVAPDNSSVRVDLPAGNYIVTFYVYDIPVFRENLTVSANVTEEYVLNNLKYEEIPEGSVVAAVELPGEIGCMYLEPEKHLGMLITNVTKPSALRLFPRVNWSYTFVVVLNALNFTYNPLTGNLLAWTPSNYSGIMVIGAPEDYPVFYFTNGTVRGYVFNHELEELSAWVGSGTHKIYYEGEPFAVTLNNTALKRGVDYSTDPLNVTTITVGSGELRIYFRNPAKVEVTIHGDTAKITVATPYRFSGKYVVKVLKGGDVVEEKSGTFTATAPLTVIDVPLGGLGAGTYEVVAEVTDVDSQRSLGTSEATYEVPQPGLPALEVEWSYWLLILVIALLAVATILALRAASKAVIEKIAERKYVRRKEGS